MRKIIPVVLTVALTLTACGGSDDQDDAADTSVVEETTVEETTAEVEEPTDAEAEEWVRSQYGLAPEDPWINAGGNASSITGVRMDGSNLYVTMQIDRSAEKNKAESVAKLLKNAADLSPNEFTEKVSWVIVEDGTGTVVKQEML